jgi:heme a synthase
MMNNKAVSLWMAIMAIFIFIMIGVGGYTRLSDSGLSMVKWHPVTGWLPPLSEEKWELEFLDYQKTPEYIKVNRHLDLQQFKSIYYVEYFHRLLGRILGLIFFLPFLIFVITGHIKGSRITLYLGIGLLGGAQGLMGWFMVKSGLVDDPNVSAYRLCAHLFLGGLLYWICLVRFAKEGWGREFPTHRFFLVTLVLLALQICSGAFVSGTEAGHAFPALWHGQGSGAWAAELGWRNIFENLLLIIFHHLVLAVLVFVSCTIWAKKLKAHSKLAFHSITMGLGIQVLLGLVTLYFYSPHRPVLLSLLHQLGGFLLLGIVTLVTLFYFPQGAPKSGDK